MWSQSRTRIAGGVGIAGATLWFVSVTMEYVFGVSSPADGGAWVTHQLVAFTGLLSTIVTYMGLIGCGAIQGRFGKISAQVFCTGMGLIVLSGLSFVILKSENSPIFILIPLGNTMYDIGGVFSGISVVATKQWTGLRRFVPLMSSSIIFLGINLPNVLGVIDGPGMIGEYVMGTCWLGVATAVFTARTRQIPA